MIQQPKLTLSPYIKLYDLLVPQNHMLRQLKDLVDFSFVNDALKGMYTLDNGRPGYEPQVMFKYLMLKRLYELSDRDVVDHARMNMGFKFFLGLAPEDDVINPSSLTKFRKLRMNDDTMDLLISKSVEIALSNGIKLTKVIIVDSTHSESRYNAKSAREYLLEVAKNLRKKVYFADESYKDKMPEKPNNTKIGIYENVIDYCQKILDIVNADERLVNSPVISENINLLTEVIKDTNEELQISKDNDAKTGHKTADSDFFGYKTHIAMTPERIITAATVTTGYKHDGKELKYLVSKTKENNIAVEVIVGDGAYSEKDNIKYSEDNDIKLVSKISKTVSDGNKRKVIFDYNKDAQRYVCLDGHMAFKVALHGKKKNISDGTVLRETHYFDVEKCKVCPKKEQCGYKGGNSKTYTVTLKKDSIHQTHIDNQNTEEYKSLSKERYKIEAKNAELKSQHGYQKAAYSGLHGMQLQAGVSIFVVNLKRILHLKSSSAAITTSSNEEE